MAENPALVKDDFSRLPEEPAAVELTQIQLRQVFRLLYGAFVVLAPNLPHYTSSVSNADEARSREKWSADVYANNLGMEGGLGDAPLNEWLNATSIELAREALPRFQQASKDAMRLSGNRGLAASWEEALESAERIATKGLRASFKDHQTLVSHLQDGVFLPRLKLS